MPQHQQPSGSSAQNPAAWLSQPGSAQSQGFQMRGAPQLPARGPSQPQNLQSSPQLHPPGQLPQNGLAPQRPGSTSRQPMSGQMGNQMSPNLPNQFTASQFPMQNGQSLAQFLPPPLDKAKFDESYAAFSRGRGIQRNEQNLSVDNRPIDLHSLHFNVLSEGGAMKV